MSTLHLSTTANRSKDSLPPVGSSLSEAGLFVFDQSIRFVNRSLAKLVGKPENELIGGDADWLLPAEEPAEEGEILLAGHQLPRSYTLTLGPSEQRVEVEVVLTPLARGAVLGMVRSLAESAAERTSNWFKHLADNTSTAIFVYRRELLYANRAFERLTNYTIEELASIDLLDLVHPDFREELGRRRERRLAGAEVVAAPSEILILCRDGTERWIEYVATTIDVAGDRAALGTAFDITDRKEAELALRASQEQLEMAQRAAQTVTWDWNLLTDELVVSQFAAELSGVPFELLPSSTQAFFDAVVHPDDRYRGHDAVLRAIRDGADLEIEHRVQSMKIEWVAERGQAIRDESGWVVRMVGVATDITRRKRAEFAQRQSDERLRLMAAQIPAVLWSTDRELIVTSTMGSGLEALGLEPSEVVGLSLYEHYGTDDPSFQPIVAHRRALEGESLTFDIDWSGNAYSVFIEPLRDQNDKIIGCLGLALDITDRRRTEEALYRAEEQVQATLRSVADGVVRIDSEGRIEFLNEVAEQLLGLTTSEAAGRPIDEVYRLTDAESQAALPNPARQALSENEPVAAPAARLLSTPDGRELKIRDSAAPVRSPTGAALGAVLAFKDVTRVEDMAREMSYLTSHDPLTGLLNRAAFERRLTDAIERHAKDRSLTLIQLDLHQFKVINDTCGHLAGDELLKEVAEVLSVELAGGDVAARLGADEFGLLLADCPEEDAAARATALLETITRHRFRWKQRKFDVSLSMGLVPVKPGETVSRVLLAADTACLLAKEQGRNSIHTFSTGDKALVKRYREMHWIERIHRALAEEKFVLHCQPIQPLLHSDPNELLGEVLVRMIGERGELVPPETFVPTAERYRLISAIDRWVVAKTFDALTRWASLGGRPVTHLALNLSGESLSDDTFAEYVVAELESSRVDPSRVLFEITETAAIANLRAALKFISNLRSRGCRFVLDDFGSGLSSFAYLKNLPVDCLKISREFVRGVAEPGIQRTLVRSINQIGHDLGLKTIAEGVADERTLRTLEGFRFDYAQGYWIAPPQPLEGV